MITLTREEFYSIAKKEYGDDKANWVFICPWCNYEQSVNSIRKNLEKDGFHKSLRYGIITRQNIKELNPKVEQECLSPTCNYASYGLIGGELKIENHNYLLLAVQQNSGIQNES